MSKETAIAGCTTNEEPFTFVGPVGEVFTFLYKDKFFTNIRGCGFDKDAAYGVAEMLNRCYRIGFEACGTILMNKGKSAQGPT